MDKTEGEAGRLASRSPLSSAVYHVDYEADAHTRAGLTGPTSAATWLTIESFHHTSSSHHPATRAVLRYSDAALLLWFEVDDRYVLSRHRGINEPVWQDSCVEFFFQPAGCPGYFNLEINAGGALLMQYGPPGNNRTALPPAVLKAINVEHSLPATVEPERTQPTRWSIACTLPYEVMEAAVGDDSERCRLRPTAGDVWRANFYKCADACSHPHWGAWAETGREKSFHQPKQFGFIHFGPNSTGGHGTEA